MSTDERVKVLSKHLTQLPDSLVPSSSTPICVGKQLCSAENSKESNGGGVPPNPNSTDLGKQKTPKRLQSAIPRNRQALLKWNGWGYKDSQFVVKDDDILHFTGNRYPIGEQALPFFTEWVKEVVGVDITKRNIPQPLPKVFPEPIIDTEFVSELRKLNIPYSLEGHDRLVRAHGQTLHDIFVLREGEFERIPDIVVWPEHHDHIVSLVQLADKRNVVVIPFGGGTSVSGAVTCPAHERRTILSLDTSQMNRILWVDRENLVACVEAGIIGQDLERELQQQGFTTGHEPDSYEFSSVGGWVATRASGMRKNVYGNIEDMLIHVRMVTPTGVLEKNCRAPRISCGPDFNHVVLGSEGTLGVITEVMLKIRPLPKMKKYGSIVFPNFDAGLACMREVARERCQPASIRLMDNEQFKFGQALRPVPGYFGLILDGLKKMYITKIKGFHLDTMCVTTLVFEGDPKDIAVQEKKIYDIAVRMGGLPAGEKNGERGYMLTFVIAYIRDLALEYNVVAESFETSVSWDRALSLCTNVKHRIVTECKDRKIDKYLISCRVTQTYDAGCCIYFYFGFNWRGLTDPLHTYEELERMARDEILSSGGSLSHHHGVGKLRQRWLPGQVSQLGVSLYHATKRQLDPNNIFANGNLHKASL